MDKLRLWIFSHGLDWFFSQAPVVKFTNGYKEHIGFLIAAVGALLGLAQHYFKEVDFDQTIAIWTTVSGVLVQYVGKSHAKFKDGIASNENGR